MSGQSDCQRDDEKEISPISPMYPSLMSGSKTDHDARKCPRSTKFSVEVSVSWKLEVVVPKRGRGNDVDWIVGELWMTKPVVDVRRMGRAEQDDDDEMDASSVGEDCEK